MGIQPPDDGRRDRLAHGRRQRARLTTPMRVTHSRVTAPQMNFFDDLQANFKKMIGPPSMPTMEEAEVYCRDDESTGCTTEMLDLLQQQKAEKAKIENFRWSREIDDAVVKPE